jgi:hypothetical protein
MLGKQAFFDQMQSVSYSIPVECRLLVSNAQNGPASKIYARNPIANFVAETADGYASGAANVRQPCLLGVRRQHCARSSKFCPTTAADAMRRVSPGIAPP